MFFSLKANKIIFFLQNKSQNSKIFFNKMIQRIISNRSPGGQINMHVSEWKESRCSFQSFFSLSFCYNSYRALWFSYGKNELVGHDFGFFFLHIVRITILVLFGLVWIEISKKKSFFFFILKLKFIVKVIQTGINLTNIYVDGVERIFVFVFINKLNGRRNPSGCLALED